MTAQGQRFRRRALRRGYKVDEVDAFLERVEATLAGDPIGTPIGAQEVHDVVFRVRFGGYDEWQVDVYLDRVERQLAALEESGMLGRAPAPARAGREERPYLGAREMTSRDMTSREMAARDMTSREMAARDMTSREMAARDMAARDMAAREMAAREMAAREMAANQMGPREDRAPYGPQHDDRPTYGAPTGDPRSPYGPQPGREEHVPYGVPMRDERPPYGPMRDTPMREPMRDERPMPPPPAMVPPTAPPRGARPAPPPPPAATPFAPPAPPIRAEPPRSPMPAIQHGFEPGRHGKMDMTAEIRAADSPFTHDDMHRLDQLRRTFQPRRFGSGYDRTQVDRLFDAIGATMAGRAAVRVAEGELDPGQFSLVQGGYFEAEVDTALREVRDLFARRGVAR